jgi:hypothetical protein
MLGMHVSAPPIRYALAALVVIAAAMTIEESLARRDR